MKKVQTVRAVIGISCAISFMTANAFGMPAAPPESGVQNRLTVTQVDLSMPNQLAGSWGANLACTTFLGTHGGNTVHFKAEASGGDGKFKHTLVYTLTRAYRLENANPGQFQVSRVGDGELNVTLPELNDEVPFIQQTAFLITQDASGKTVTTALHFLVARPVILTPAPESRAKELNCMERGAAYESAMGVLSNGSGNPSEIHIKQGIQKIFNSRAQAFGVYAQPEAKADLMNLASLNAPHFAEVSRQTIETVEVSSSFTLNPGDFLQVYLQPTRYVSAYDATLLQPCGMTQKLDGAYLFQWWGFSYHVYPVDPLDPKRPPAGAIGAPMINTCPKELNALPFLRTNP